MGRQYNVPDGRILVRTEAGKCVIENTGKTMEEEQLLHAFDLFYTGIKAGEEGEAYGDWAVSGEEDFRASWNGSDD